MHFQELRGTCKEDGALSRITARLREKTPHFRERRCTCENDGALSRKTVHLREWRRTFEKDGALARMTVHFWDCSELGRLWHDHQSGTRWEKSDAHMPRFQVRLWHFCCILFDRTVHVIYIYSMHRMHIYVFAARSRPCHRDAVCLAGFVFSFLHRLWELWSRRCVNITRTLRRISSPTGRTQSPQMLSKLVSYIYLLNIACSIYMCLVITTQLKFIVGFLCKIKEQKLEITILHTSNLRVKNWKIFCIICKFSVVLLFYYCCCLLKLTLNYIYHRWQWLFSLVIFIMCAHIVQHTPENQHCGWAYLQLWTVVFL